MTAQTAVLPDEDPEAFRAFAEARVGTLRPANQVESDFVESYVISSWQLKRCLRAHTGLLCQQMQHAEAQTAMLEKDAVLALGARLFWDRRDNFRLYPHGNDVSPHRTSCSKVADDPDDPARLVNRLESTLTGCRWLLCRWAELRERLLPGLFWQSQDKLRACRLLGKQPMDVCDEPQVCQIFLASHVINPQLPSAFAEILFEFDPEFEKEERRHLLTRIKGRPWKALRPQNENDARQALMKLVDKATHRLQMIAAEHQKRADLYADAAAQRLAFDPSNEAERLRRYEGACTRQMRRAIDSLLKIREAGIANDWQTDELDGRDGESGPECRAEDEASGAGTLNEEGATITDLPPSSTSELEFARWLDYAGPAQPADVPAECASLQDEGTTICDGDDRPCDGAPAHASQCEETTGHEPRQTTDEGPFLQNERSCPPASTQPHENGTGPSYV